MIRKTTCFIEDDICLTIMVHVVKIIEIVGTSEKDWTDAAQVALDEAKKPFTE